MSRRGEGQYSLKCAETEAQNLRDLVGVQGSREDYKTAEQLMEERERDANALAKFKSMLKGWMRNPDGEDLCPAHWQTYLKKFDHDPQVRLGIVEDSKPTAVYAERLRKPDGWGAWCEKCSKDVWVKTKITPPSANR